VASDSGISVSAATAAAAAAAAPPPPAPLSRAGLQGLRSRLFVEERARHIVGAAKWAVAQALGAAARGETEVELFNVADVTPTPAEPPALPSASGFYGGGGMAAGAASPGRLMHETGLVFVAAQFIDALGNAVNPSTMTPQHDSEVRRLAQELAAVQQGLQHFGLGPAQLPPAAVRELFEAKQLQVDARLQVLHRAQLAAAQVACGVVALSCLGDVARAVAAALPGVSVEATERGGEVQAAAQAAAQAAHAAARATAARGDGLAFLQRQDPRMPQPVRKGPVPRGAAVADESVVHFVLPPPPAPAAVGLRISWA